MIGPGHVRHLYVHLPFCAHRCGYCDFVTVVGRREQHAAYVDALLAELELEASGPRAGARDASSSAAARRRSPSRGELARLLEALPAAAEVTVEANPETVTPELAALLATAGVTRVSLGAQSFRPHLLGVLERRAVAGRRPARRSTICVMPASTTSRSTSSTGSRARAPPTSTATSPRRSRSGRSTSRATSSRRSRARASRMLHGAELARQAEAMEGYFERVVER